MPKDLISQILTKKSNIKKPGLQVTLTRIKKRLDLKSIDQAACYYIKKYNLDINVSSVIDDITRKVVQDGSISKDRFRSSTKIRGGKQIRKPVSKSEDPFLDNQTFDTAYNNAEIYPIIYMFENSVRQFVVAVMKRKFGGNWWTERVETVNTKIHQNVTTRKLAEKEAPWHSGRGADPIFFTDIDDLKKIINTNSKEFREILAGKFEHVIVWIDEIEKTRNILAHNNPGAKKDKDRLVLYAHDWSKYTQTIFEKLK